ncbi:MAG: ribonuclease [Acidobacteria bacterium]|nr:MAG: ribonuclease [Acidobacteriota bacterium]
MRVLPGMQSAFVDIGLERDAFLYVSDFFDEEEEFERIVIDKAKKGAVDAEKAAAEQIALGRVEREHQIEAAQERGEPLREAEVPTPAFEEQGESEGGRRRGRRGRRRGRTREAAEERTTQPSEPAEPEWEGPLSAFVTGDPSIQRISDDEETADSGEMFKDARLQERIFDQIHAIEFNLEDDVRTAEVGSVLPGASLTDESFQRVDDTDIYAETQPHELMSSLPVAAHLETFVDDVSGDTLAQGSFERVSDEEEVTPVTTTRRGRKAAATGEGETKKKRTTKRTATAKASQKKSSSKRGSAKKRKAPLETESGELFADSEARITSGPDHAEFATRRGGRRRRRPGKQRPQNAPSSGANGRDADADVPTETSSTTEVIVAQPSGGDGPGRERPRHNGGFRGSRRERHQPAITDLLREGQEILVQIAKEPIAKKGARITSHIALPGRFLVYMPTVEHVGVSRKIESDSERQRLRKIIQQLRTEEDVPSGGFIVRTAGVGTSEKDLREDVRYLVRTWLDIRGSAEKSKPATLVHRDLDLVQRILRDQLSDDFESVRVDSEEEYQRIVEFVNRIHPKMVKRVKLYTREQPILESYGVQSEIDKAIKPRVWLRSGGYLVINQTEALVSIDVNTGKFVGRGGGRLEDTITRTNLEAVEEIVRQIRLRDLGGIIVLDLIDMEERRNRQKVMQALQDALRYDKSPTKVLSFNDFGLVIMTRKRVKQSLERTLCAPCPYCQGAGLIKSPQTICYELLEEARRLSKNIGEDKANQATLRINPEVAKALRTSERDVLTEIEDYLGPVDISSDPEIHQEQFDFAFI